MNKKDFFRKSWVIGFVRGGMDALFSDKPMAVDWVKNPYKDRWFADPFILDVDEDNIYLLAEECRYGKKGRIAKLTVDKDKFEMVKMDILLDLDTHLSFPNIIRHNGKIYVYPENCHSGKLDIYEYDAQQEKLDFVQTICDEAVWDADITHLFGRWQLFAGVDNHYCLDIYDWDDHVSRFVHKEQYTSPRADYRLAGQLFEYKGDVYIPAQDCSENYGGAVILYKAMQNNGKLELTPVKRFKSPNKRMNQGMHTLNQYKDLVVIDIRGFNSLWAHCIYNSLQFLNSFKGVIRSSNTK